MTDKSNGRSEARVTVLTPDMYRVAIQAASNLRDRLEVEIFPVATDEERQMAVKVVGDIFRTSDRPDDVVNHYEEYAALGIELGGTVVRVTDISWPEPNNPLVVFVNECARLAREMHEI